jgi:hypothetical protein
MNQAGQFGGSSENEQNGNSPGGGSGGNNGNNNNPSNNDLHNDDPELLKQQIIKALPQNMLAKSGNNNFTDLLQMLSQQHTQNYSSLDTQPPMGRVDYQGGMPMVGNPSAMMRVIPEYGLGSNNVNTQGLGDYNQSPLTGMHNMQSMQMVNTNSNSNWTPDELTKLNECLAK